MPYQEYIFTRRIIDKLGLKDTYPELTEEAEHKLAHGHTPILFNPNESW